MSEIARAWSKVATDEVTVLSCAISVAFFRGAFEFGDGSSVLFTLQQPDTDRVSGTPPSIALDEFRQRRPGDYATREDGVIVMVGKDLHSFPTADRRIAPVYREFIAWYHFATEWLGLTAGLPEGFYQWTDEMRDVERPHRRDKYEAAFLALSTIPFDRWPADLRKAKFPEWRIERHEFQDWYRTSPLSAGVPLTGFWPVAAGRATHVEGKAGELPAGRVVKQRKIRSAGNAKSGRKRIFVDAHWAILEAETYRLLDQHGGLTEDDPKFNSKAKLIKLLQVYAQEHPKFSEVEGTPEKETMRPRVNHWIAKWEARKSAGN